MIEDEKEAVMSRGIERLELKMGASSIKHIS
jgi:hypothetical protein